MHEGHTPSRFQAILLIVALLCGSLLHGHLHVCIQSHDTTRQLPAGQCRNVLSHADSPQAVTVENAWFCPICAGLLQGDRPQEPTTGLFPAIVSSGPAIRAGVPAFLPGHTSLARAPPDHA